MEIECSEHHRVHREAGVAGWERKSHLFQSSGRRLLVAAGELFNVAIEVAWVAAVGAIGQDRLAHADEVRPESTNRVLPDVRRELTARCAEQEDPKVLVQVLRPKRNVAAKELHFAFVVHVEAPANELADDHRHEWHAKTDAVKHLVSDRRLVERVHKRLVVTEESALVCAPEKEINQNWNADYKEKTIRTLSLATKKTAQLTATNQHQVDRDFYQNSSRLVVHCVAKGGSTTGRLCRLLARQSVKWCSLVSICFVSRFRAVFSTQHLEE